MATPRVKVEVDQPAWLRMIREKQRPVATAAVAALNDVAKEAVAEGRRNIASSGRFGRKWQTGLKYRMKNAKAAGGEPSLQAEAEIFHSLAIAGVFEFGATIEGQPLLWLPTVPGLPPPKRSGRKLISANVRGQPVLFAADDSRGRQRKPLYVGVPSVRIRKIWRIVAIVKENAKKMAFFFIQHFKGD